MLSEDETTHRFIQQYTIPRKLSGWRFAQRFASDQTITENSETEIRLRYRLTGEFPLNGQTVDTNELYVKINHEYVNDFFRW